jgi:hypothetical protein
MADKKGGDLFIVDNSISGWTGNEYLKQWTDLAKAFDIATGYFEIGALLELDGQWQKLDKIRILMGDETTGRTKKALLEGIRTKVTEILDASIEQDKDKNPFLGGVPGIIKALESGQIECRIYNRDKFHAKAYITHAKLEVVCLRSLCLCPTRVRCQCGLGIDRDQHSQHHVGGHRGRQMFQAVATDQVAGDVEYRRVEEFQHL